MKVSPLAQSSGNPGQTLGAVDIGRTASPTKIARAKAIAMGQEVKEEEPLQPVVQADKQNVHSIKMQTQRSTNREELPPEEVPQVEAAPESSVLATNEAPVEETKPLSPQFAALAKQRRALQLERAQFEKEKAAAASQAPANGSNDIVERLKSQPLSVLQEHGISYDQLTEAILANQDGSSQKLREFESKLTALEQGFDKKLNERDAQAKAAALNEMRREADRLAKDGEAFELVRETGNVPKVIELIDRTFETTGEILDVSEAMQLVEDDLLNESTKFAKLKKVQSRLAPEPPVTQAQSAQQPAMRTLTNRDGAATPMDRRTRAILAMRGQLKR